MRKLFGFFFGTLVVALISSWAWHGTARLPPILQKISVGDKACLEAFLRSLIAEENGAYVLFGDKPASVAFLPESDFFSSRIAGYNVWNAHFGCSKSYAILELPQARQNLRAYFLIHRPRLLKIVAENWSDFSAAFPKCATPRAFLDRLQADAASLHTLCNDDYLLGLALGFGKENAALCTAPPYAVKQSGAAILDGNERSLTALKLLFPLGYAIDPAYADPRALQEKYTQQRRLATERYRSGSFLETTLKALTSGD